MDNNTQIPKQIKDFAESAELYDLSEKIGQKFGLHIDQIGYMDSEIRKVLLGMTKSADFSANLMREAEVSRNLADQIIVEINNNVFSVMRQAMQNGSEEHIAGVEQAGNFQVDRPAVMPIPEPMSHDDKAQVLNQLETTEALPRTIPAQNPMATPIYSDPLVDHLLKTASTSNQENVIKNIEPQVPKNSVVKPVDGGAPQSPDPYREPSN